LIYLFVGGGNMGYALAAALIRRKVCAPQDITVADPIDAIRKRAAVLGCLVTERPTHSDGRVVVLAVKPQQAQEAMQALTGSLKPDQVVVSIMAGVRLATIQAAMKHQAIVRVMPNTPAQIGLGMNAYYADPVVTAKQLEPVHAMLSASGEALLVASEDLIDAATAVSGSGPAYVFYLAEHWMRAAEALGFSPTQATALVRQTLRGATELWQSSGISAKQLREQVTSKGGTTAAALDTSPGSRRSRSRPGG